MDRPGENENRARWDETLGFEAWLIPYLSEQTCQLWVCRIHDWPVSWETPA